MLRHNYLRDIPRRSRYEKNTQPTLNQQLSTRLVQSLKKVYNALKILQDLTIDHDIETSDITQLKYIYDYIERFMMHHTSIELLRPPQYFPSSRLTYIRR
jgi:hypothetical protein